MIIPLLNNFSTLIVTVRRNILSSLLTTLLILLLIIGWSAKDAISIYLNGAVTGEHVTNEERDAQIARRLTAILTTTNADRVVIREFSNEAEEDGQVVPYLTTTHFVVAAGIADPPAALMRTPRSTLGHLVTDMTEKNICVTMTPADIPDVNFRETVTRQTGAAFWLMCPIYDLDNKPIGYIAASYVNQQKSHPANEVIHTVLSDEGKRLSGYLGKFDDTGKPWYKSLF